MTELSKKDFDNLKHMLGICKHIKRRNWGDRNHFAPRGDDIQSMKRLESAELVWQDREYDNGVYVYHATLRGCIIIGLPLPQTRRALGRHVED